MPMSSAARDEALLPCWEEGAAAALPPGEGLLALRGGGPDGGTAAPGDEDGEGADGDGCSLEGDAGGVEENEGAEEGEDDRVGALAQDQLAEHVPAAEGAGNGEHGEVGEQNQLLVALHRACPVRAYLRACLLSKILAAATFFSRLG